ncbi:MAG: T9SS type A sorting domain-containing protein [Lewinellaceae bacterium]|nr:T9SS type A sorting domain-containing protein [Lewinellaceae bacterium]
MEYQSGEDIPEEAASYIIAQLQALIDALNEGTVVCDEGDAPPRPGNTTVSSAALSLEIHPNPFSTRADIRFYLPQAGPVQLEVFNLQGQRVHSLLSGQLDKGISEFSWDGTAENGQRLNSGIYLIRLSSADEVVVKRVSLMR